jgi:exodeoxyribonuclease-3
LNEAKLAGEHILVMGDFNTAHQAIDLARPKSNKKTSGFLPEERDEMSRWLRGGWVDTFRHYHPDEPEHYSWWSQRTGARGRNVGWRIDYIMASPGAMPFVRGAHIHPLVMGSDHCPISVDLDPDVLK